MLIDFVNARNKEKFVIVSKVENDFQSPVILSLPTEIENPADPNDPYLVDVNKIRVYNSLGREIPQHLLAYIGQESYEVWDRIQHWNLNLFGRYRRIHHIDHYFNLAHVGGRPIQRHYFVVKPFYVEGQQYSPHTITKINEIIHTFVPKETYTQKLPIRLTLYNQNQEIVIGEHNELILLHLPVVLKKDLIKVVDITGDPRPLRFAFMDKISGDQLTQGYLMVIEAPKVYPQTKRIIEIQYSADPTDDQRLFMTDEDYKQFVKVFKTPDLPYNQPMLGMTYKASDFTAGVPITNGIIQQTLGFDFSTDNPNLDYEIEEFHKTSYLINLYVVPSQCYWDNRITNFCYPPNLDKGKWGFVFSNNQAYGEFAGVLPQRLMIFINVHNKSYSCKDTDYRKKYNADFFYVNWI